MKPLAIIIGIAKGFAAFAWTTLVIAALLNPGRNASLHERSVLEFVSLFFNLSLGSYNYREGFVHMVLFAVLTALWFWVLDLHFETKRAMLWSFVIAAMIGTSTEVGQYFVDRGSLFLDLIANFLGIFFALFLVGFNAFDWSRRPAANGNGGN